MKTSLETKGNIFLVQRVLDDDTICTSLMDEFSLTEYINFNDVYNEKYEIWQVNSFGKVEHCHYAGWQPNCLIQIINDNTHQIVLESYGEDH